MQGHETARDHRPVWLASTQNNSWRIEPADTEVGADTRDDEKMPLSSAVLGLEDEVRKTRKVTREERLRIGAAVETAQTERLQQLAGAFNVNDEWRAALEEGLRAADQNRAWLVENGYLARSAEQNDPAMVRCQEGRAHRSASISLGARLCSGATVEKDAFIVDAIIGRDATVRAGAIINRGAVIRERADIGAKTRILQDVVVGTRASIGQNNTINAHALIGDDVRTGEYVEIGDDAVVGTGTTIGNASTIAGNTTLGVRCRIGARVSIEDGVKLESDVEMQDDSDAECGCEIGRGNRIRAGSKVQEGAVIPRTQGSAQ